MNVKDLVRWVGVVAVSFALAFVLMALIVVVASSEPLPIDHELDAGRAAQVSVWTSEKSEVAAEETRVWIGDRRCCMECDGHMVCASAVECGGVACRGRDVKVLLPCGALAFCGGDDE